MIDSLTRGQRRVLAVAILVLALGAVFSVTALPVLLANRHYQETIVDMQGRLQQLQRAAAIGASLQPQYEQLKRWQTTDAQYLKSSSAALAAAELQRLLKRIIVANKAQVMSTQILATKQEEGFDRISLKARIRGALENIVRAFYVLETADPYIFLENVSIRASAGRRVGGHTSPVQTLDIDMELTGYMSPSP